MTRTIVVGLDGAGWRLIEPWIEEGILPNIRDLRSTGTWATSRSCLPPVTFPNWKCYSSGKNPGKFGVFWWERIDLKNGSIPLMSGRDYRTAELWDYLNEGGFSTGIVNMPSMYPPRDINGFIVSGGPDAVEGEYRSLSSGYTYPRSLERKLKKEFDYRVHPEPLLSSNTETGDEVDAILDLLDKRFRVAEYLLHQEQLDFLHVTLFYLNVLHHFFWDEEPTKRAWRLVDEWIGKLSDIRDANLIIMSDHGSAKTKTEFYINEWLIQQGYISKRWSPVGSLRQLGITRENALSIAKDLGIVDLLAEHLPERLQQRIPSASGAKRQQKLDLINIKETKALGSGQGPVYVNDLFDRDAIRDELVDSLHGLTDADDEPLFAGIHFAEDVYTGPYVDIGPDIVIDQAAGVHINDGIGSGVVQTVPKRWAAENTPEGIFIANGPDYQQLGEIAPVKILDIMPTILASYGVPRPEDVDGEILPIVERDDRTQSPITLSRTNNDQRDETVGDRLRQLGYLE